MVLDVGRDRYEVVEGFFRRPRGWTFVDVADVAVDTDDNVWVFSRSAHPVMVFDRDGHFLDAWGELVPVQVEGVPGKRFVLADEVAALEAPPEPPPSVAFLPPFDPLVWDRRLLGSLFGFEYVWELFKPPAERRWGWYVLPVVYRDRLVGRIEPRIDREQARVEMLDVWWEDGFEPARADGFVEAMRDALRAYLRFAGAERFEWPAQLGREKRLFLPRP